MKTTSDGNMMRLGKDVKRDRKYDLACLGILVLDAFGRCIDKFPKKGESEYFDALEIHPGGCAYNTGIDAIHLGMNVGIIGKVGNDNFGSSIINAVKDHGGATEGIVRSSEASTAFSFVMVPSDGNRRIYHTPGVNRTFGPNDVKLDIIENSSILHIAGATLMPALDGEPIVKLLKYAKSKGVATSLDPAVKPGIKDIIVPCLQYLDVFLPNTEESFYITGFEEPEKQLAFYLSHGVKVAGIKMGISGCLVGYAGKVIRMGVYDVPVSDTCGAGDAFIAGFLYGFLNDWDLADCARFATATAAFCVQALGAASSVPRADHVHDFIQKNLSRLSALSGSASCGKA